MYNIIIKYSNEKRTYNEGLGSLELLFKLFDFCASAHGDHHYGDLIKHLKNIYIFFSK